MSNIRLRTTPGGEDKFLNLNIDQKFDFIEIYHTIGKYIVGLTLTKLWDFYRFNP